MAFIEIIFGQNTVILRAQTSELLILPQHTVELKKLTDPTAFSQYFINQALVNRPARKLFEAWLRKDRSIWPRLYRCVHDRVQTGDETPRTEAKAEKKQKPVETAEVSENKPKATKAKPKAAKAKTEEETPKKSASAAPKKKTSTTGTKAKTTSKSSAAAPKKKTKAK